ncbi:MAG: metal transporter permease [Amycolatopsis sp.]|jgi:zinc/manganese transport system permease protein|uniref:metal ABC transporter permease n=1 Tax=Amycolatopsis sp. TaxID=37632 RepID=UPI0026327F85|nr:metal ABC transporter permease [Amycolatopsis sp.]MCU1679432.1 metal transporter permease [Amycolatopsis sp.]
MNLFDPLSHPFFAHALLAGVPIAAACGLVGYFLVLRAQIFTGDALSHVAFTGALGALAFGVDERLGLFVTTILVAVLMGTLGAKAVADDVVIGSIFAWILGLGVFFLTLYTTSRSSGNGSAGVNVLFGSIFGISAGQAQAAAAIGGVLCLLLVGLARPLLFATIDPAVAAARGVPVRLVGLVFLALVGACSAEATQAVGALLLLGLLAAPAGAAQRLTTRPYVALGLSMLLAVFDMVAGLGLSYGVAALPPSFAILAVATGVYVVVLLVTSAPAKRLNLTRP